MKALLFPIFLYGQTVQIHTQTPEMAFYRCGGVGTVQSFKQDDGCHFVCDQDETPDQPSKLLYYVEFSCGSHVVSDWIDGENLRLAFQKK